MSSLPRNRDIGLDLTRILAFIFVPCVHFFLNSGFYQQPVLGPRMYLMVLLRTLFMTCVPLFMLLSGYLLAERDIRPEPKELGTYYRRLFPLWLSYALATVLILLYRTLVRHEPFTVVGTLDNLLGFSQYSWYVNMYLGFSLLIPFFNLIWKSIASPKGARALLLVLFALTILPSVLNVYDLKTPGALVQPHLTTTYTRLIPNWWTKLYPVTYYFLGAYLKRYVDIKSLKTGRLTLLFVLSLLLFSAYNIWRSYTKVYVQGIWVDWGGLQNTVDTVLLFLILNSVRYPQPPRAVSALLSYLSSLTFTAYLCSWITDDFLYNRLKQSVPKMTDRLDYFPITVGLSVAVSLVLAMIIQWIVKGSTGRRKRPADKTATPPDSASPLPETAGAANENPTLSHT